MKNRSYEELKNISDSCNPRNFASNLEFQEGLVLAKEMLDNDEWDQELQEYAVKLLEEIRKNYQKEWNSSWKFDAFLGYAYHIILKYDERFAAYKRAFEKVSSPPPQLLVAMARCCWAPGIPPITEEESISLVKQALLEKPYYEAFSLLRGLYKSIGNTIEEAYCEDVLKNMKGKEIHLLPLDDVP